MKLAVLLVLLLAVLVPPPAAAASGGESRHLWATVNVCDTEAHPDAIGIRASMPGSGRRETLLMRFRVQYLDAADGEWRFVAAGADSGLREVGVTRTRRVESGHNFEFKPPAGGERHVLRGHVTFVWRRGTKVTRQATEVTERGHRSSRGADPPGYSAATCRIS